MYALFLYDVLIEIIYSLTVNQYNIWKLYGSIVIFSNFLKYLGYIRATEQL